MALDTNFYIVAPVAILETPLPIEVFSYIDENGVQTYHDIVSFLATHGHTVDRFSNDKSKFCKGFEFSISTLDEVRARFVEFNLAEGIDVLILTHKEALELLATPEWKKEDVL